MVSKVQPTVTVYPHHNEQQNNLSNNRDDKDRDSDASDCEGESSGGDTCSVTSETQKDNNNGALVLKGEDLSTSITRPAATFGTVAVTNSTDVHFGNKTYYQGPVTIRQILYAGQQNDVKVIGQDDLTVDGVIISNGEKREHSTSIVAEGEEERRNEDGLGRTDNKFMQKCNQWLPNVSSHRTLLIGGVAMVIMIILTVTAVLLVKNMAVKNEGSGYPVDSTEQETGVPITGPNVNTTLPSKLKIISRLEWVAQPPTEPANALPLPAPYAIIMHTATENCTDQPACVFHVRYIQSYHMDSRGWWDIGYNFLVGGDGNAYEGRGWKSEGAHTYGYNTRSIGIAFIGTFNKYMPPSRQIIACKQLLQKGVELGYLKKDYKLLAARQVSTTQSPGDSFYEDIKTWPHWAENP